MPVERHQQDVAFAALTALPPEGEHHMGASVGPAGLEVERRHHAAGFGFVVAIVEEKRCHQQTALGLSAETNKGIRPEAWLCFRLFSARNQGPTTRVRWSWSWLDQKKGRKLSNR